MAITYYYNQNKLKLYINIIERFQCTNSCVFCDKDYLTSLTTVNLFLDKSPTINEIVESVNVEITELVDELVFCGLGEPTLYLDTLLGSTKLLKKAYNIPIRLNTNGQAHLINPERTEILKELKQVGFDRISISLNSITKEEYNRLHNPKYKDAFDSVVKFIQDCYGIGLETYVSFIEFPDFKRFTALEFIKNIGLTNNNVNFRKYI